MNSRERIRNRCPVGDSTLNPLPRPGTTSTVRWVWLQYANCDSDIQNGIGCGRPGIQLAEPDIDCADTELAVRVAHR